MFTFGYMPSLSYKLIITHNMMFIEIRDEFQENKNIPNVVSVCIGDLPTDGVKYALEYCK